MEVEQTGGGLCQNWVIENIDIMMKVFMKINGPMSKQNKSKHKQNILKNADTISYRAIYVLAREKKEEIRIKRHNYELYRENKRLKLELKIAKGEPIGDYEPPQPGYFINLSKDTLPPSS
jgi:hypothetical protein